MADEIIVMYAGMVFERAQAIDIFRHSGNPYTPGLLRSVPDPAAPKAHLHQIPGLPPDLTAPRRGCPFAPRCEMATDTCRNEFPPFVALTPTHFSLCHYARDVHEGRSPGAGGRSRAPALRRMAQARADSTRVRRVS